MTMFGKAVKGILGLAAGGADFVLAKTAQGLGKKLGDNEMIKTASEIGSGTVRVTEATLKTFTDVVDGGIEAGMGYLSKDEDKQSNGLQQAKTAGKEIVTGMAKGVVYTAAAGAETASSAATAGKHLMNGDKGLARQEFDRTKAFAKHLGKTVAVGLLAFGPPPDAINNDKNQNTHEVSDEDGNSKALADLIDKEPTQDNH